MFFCNFCVMELYISPGMPVYCSSISQKFGPLRGQGTGIVQGMVFSFKEE